MGAGSPGGRANRRPPREDLEFGYRILLDEARDADHIVAERTAWRICSDNGWSNVFGKKWRGRKVRPGMLAHDDLARRDFTAAGPNRLADRHHLTLYRRGQVYLRAVEDEWLNRIVDYSIADRMQSFLAVAALDSAAARRGGAWQQVAGCVLIATEAADFEHRNCCRR